MDRKQLEESVKRLIGKELRDLTLFELYKNITASQFITDTLLNEIESRGELTFREGHPIIPYHSDVYVETILTR